MSGKKQDGIIHLSDGTELGAHEATLFGLDFDTKVLNDGLELRRTMKDMLCRLQDKVRRYRPLVQKLNVVGLLTRPKECTILHMLSRGNFAFVQESVYSVPIVHGRIGEYVDLLRAVREIAKVAEKTQRVVQNPRAHLSPAQRKEFDALKDKQKWPPPSISLCKPMPLKTPTKTTQARPKGDDSSTPGTSP